jgi:SAM-dependent methyltransferase
MKNVYHSMRPAWAKIEKSETALIFGASFSFVVYALAHDLLTPWIIRRFNPEPTKIHVILSLSDLIVFTFGVRLVLQIYKRLSIGCYPSTFLYSFLIPEASNPSGKSNVLGYCHVRPLVESGEVQVVGASFFWEDGQLDRDSRVGFTSTLVHGTNEHDNESTCHIEFSINPADVHKRNYTRGILQFRLDRKTSVQRHGGPDVYAGYLQAVERDAESSHSKGYAQFFSKGPLYEKQIQVELERRGDELFTMLREMLRAAPSPTLWEGVEETEPNYWSLQIPKPQAVVLNQNLWPYIDKLLSQVLSLAGLNERAIHKFKKLVVDKAKLNAHFTRVEYERDLKQELVGLVKPGRINRALFNRAEIIKGQIDPFLVGDSLLDIGCGNGMIADLVQNHFKRIQLLDVVDYLGELQLPFKLYKDGEPFPVEGIFDTVLLLTVLHHSKDPKELLKYAWRSTKNRLIVIESVVGVDQPRPGVKYDLIKEPIRTSDRICGFRGLVL